MSKTPKNMVERKDVWKGELQHKPDATATPMTEKELDWVNAYVDNGGDVFKAADAAGITKDEGKALLADARARSAIELRRDVEIKTRVSTKALSVMESLLDDPAAPAQVKMNVAKWFLEASGHGLSAVAASLTLGNKQRKDLSEMSVSELEEIAVRGRQAWEAMRGTANKVLQDGHQVVDVTPDKLSDGKGNA